MFALDRPINDIPEHGLEGSCVHATPFCHETCYNMKLYKLYPKMLDKDLRNEAAWQAIDGGQIRKSLAAKRKPTSRARFMTRGEAIKDFGDLKRVIDICTKTLDMTLWWMPTRAWRNPLLMSAIEKELFPIKNLAVLASLDPSNTDDEWQMLKMRGWSTMFYGDDDMLTTPAGDRMFKCPKTHKQLKGHCSICKAGCFAPKTLNRRVDVHLSKH